MYRTSVGYLFEAPTGYRTGVDGAPAQVIGVKEEYSVLSDGNVSKIKAVFGLDVNMSPTQPVFFQHENYLGLDKLIMKGNMVEEMTKFLRSKRAVYSLMGYVYLICEISGKLDLQRAVWSDDTVCNFYSPKQYVRIPSSVTKSAEPKMGIATEKLSTAKELNCILVNPQYLAGMRNVVLERIKPCVMTKEKFLFARIGVRY